MVDAATLSYDIASVAVSAAIPAVAWALWFGLAWKHPAFAESLGLGRRGFWLLLPGALLASFALLPLAPIASDILAVSFAGAVFPLAIGILALERYAPPLRRATLRLFVPLSLEVTGLLALVVAAERSGATALFEDLAVAGGAAAASVAYAALARQAPLDRALAGAFGLTNVGLALTFVGSAAVPGLGITETFPFYLLPPLLVGALAVLLAPRLFPEAPAFALPLGFLAAGWGVTLGADVLREPPLYGTGPAGLYAIGGAGVLDLVYLSAFLGLLGAWGLHHLLGRDARPVGSPSANAPPSPTTLLRSAFLHGVDGRLAPSLRASAAAARGAGLQAQRLRGRSPRADAPPWDGLGVPGWVVSDTANLESVARRPSDDPQEAVRAWVTARALVRLGDSLSSGRFASSGQRLLAFGLDTVVIGAAATAVFVAIALASPGNLAALLGGVGYNAAIYGVVAGALIYFALSESWTATTVGKRLVGIEVRDRALARVDGLGAFVRNTPLLPALTLFSVGLALSVAVALRGLGVGGAGVSLFSLPIALAAVALFVVAGVALCGAVGLLVMRLTAEHQRVGDLWAGTWVVRRASPAAAPAEAPPAAPSA